MTRFPQLASKSYSQVPMGPVGPSDTSPKNPTFCDNSRGIGHSEWEGPEKSAKEEFQVVNVFGYCQLFVKIA